MDAAQKIMRRCDALAKITEEPGKITRIFATPAMRRANTLVAGWMREAGMKTRLDPVGNLIGSYAGQKPEAKILLLGSHLDTVRNGGKFDGPLGVLLALACVERVQDSKTRLPFAIQVIGFADEEGVRYQTAYLGSRALAGCFDEADLKRKDANGISMADAIRCFGGDPTKVKSARMNPDRLVGYVEAHIEQGPVLEANKLSLGIVSAIAGQTRARVRFIGHAGHAGTTPMRMRKDALCAAAELVLAAESLAKKTAGLVATAGEISAQPGASNVIPGEAGLSLDVRHAKDGVRQACCSALRKAASQIASRRKLQLRYEIVHEVASAGCSLKLSKALAAAVKRRQKKSIQLASGAGHDAAVMANISPTAMLFIRCKGGVSHHPAESVKIADIRMAIEVLSDFIQTLAGRN